MNKKIFDFCITLISKIVNKKIIYFSGTKNGLPVAVKSKYGFWYYGDIFDQSDIAYGVASNGTVEAFDTETVVSILKKLKSDFTFYDIGSNTGWYTMISSTINSMNTVYSFEPISEHIACQKETISLNKKESQVQIFEIALSDHSGSETIRLAGSGTSLDGGFLEVDFGTRKVNLQTLDSLVEENKLTNPDFIKIDVEGHEYNVLQGSKKIIASSTPILFVEIAKTFNSLHFVNKNFEKTFSLLKSFGYTPFIVNNGSIRKFDTSTDVDGVHMYLFLNEVKHINNLNLKDILPFR